MGLRMLGKRSRRNPARIRLAGAAESVTWGYRREPDREPARQYTVPGVTWSAQLFRG
jgi:hypothetical protein